MADSKQPMRVLVTGSTGWLGQFVCRMLLSEDLFRSSTVELYAAYHNSEPEWVQVDHRVHLDLTNSEEVRTAIDRIRPDVVVHLAAISSPAVCNKDPTASELVNCPTVLTKAIIRFVPNCLFIFSSTDLVYDGESPPYQPLATLSTPDSPYGSSKLSFEQHVLSLPNGIVLRLSNMLGPRFAYRHAGAKFLQWLFESYQKKETVGLRYDEIRSFVLVDDVLHIIQMLLQITALALSSCSESTEMRVFDDSLSPVFNVGGPQGLSRLELANLLTKCCEDKLRIIPPPSSPDEGIPAEVTAKYVTDRSGIADSDWRVFCSSNADSIKASGIYNPRDVTMDISQTEKFFNFQFTPAEEAIRKLIKDF